ncbi:hypothetical protein ACFC8N_34585 [Streptomyces sp. NPDC055966]|uniref:hypothetical protein n=1 Tax=Streptomyces sp. NPDC055966 TaxID=3345669 RepID=UPI0035D5DBBE
MVLVLSPFLLLLSPLMGLYCLARSARRVAWRLFLRDPGSVPVRDPDVARLKRLRTCAAIGVSLADVVAFGSVRDIGESLSDRWSALLTTPWLLVVSAPVVFMAFVWCAPSSRRRTMWAALRGSLRQLGLFVSTLLLIVVLVVCWSVADPSRLGGSAGTWLSLAFLAGVMWSVFLFLFASAAVARTGFGAAAVHPAAPPVLATFLVWTFAATAKLPSGPTPIAYALFIGGPATVTAIAWWEIHRLRTRFGVRLRGG